MTLRGDKWTATMDRELVYALEAAIQELDEVTASGQRLRALHRVSTLISLALEIAQRRTDRLA